VKIVIFCQILCRNTEGIVLTGNGLDTLVVVASDMQYVAEIILLCMLCVVIIGNM